MFSIVYTGFANSVLMQADGGNIRSAIAEPWTALARIDVGNFQHVQRQYCYTLVGCRCGDLSRARSKCAYAMQLMPLPVTITFSSKSTLVLPLWYRLNRLVPDKGPLNGCCC